jgi:hypothetical protein
MPRRRPRVGQSVVDETTWGAAGQPPDQFVLRFNNATGAGPPLPFDYTYGGAPGVSLQALLAADGDADLHPPPSFDAAHAWAGLAQPLEIHCRHRAGANAYLPQHFECSFTHAHRRWADVDELGDEGNFRGLARGMHEHVFRMDEWVFADIVVVPGQPPETRWFARHAH